MDIIEGTNIRTLTQRFEYFHAHNIDYKTIVNNVMTRYGLTHEEALLGLIYTDMSISGKLNDILRKFHPLENLSDMEQRRAIEYIRDTLISAYRKLPDMDGKVVARADNWDGRQNSLRQGTPAELPAFTSVTGDMMGTFVDTNHTKFLVVEASPGQVKDISSLSL